MIDISTSNRSVLFYHPQTCVHYSCKKMTKRIVHIVSQPPKFSLPPPPNPLNFVNPIKFFAGQDPNEYSKEKFLLYFLSYQDDSIDKCKNLRIQLLANGPSYINNIQPKTVPQSFTNSNKIVSIHEPANFSTNSAVHLPTQILNQNSFVNQSTNFFSFFNIILFTITIFLLIGLILLVIYLIVLK